MNKIKQRNLEQETSKAFKLMTRDISRDINFQAKISTLNFGRKSQEIALLMTFLPHKIPLKFLKIEILPPACLPRYFFL